MEALFAPSPQANDELRYTIQYSRKQWKMVFSYLLLSDFDIASSARFPL